ncbi:hypothetical protein EW145_g2637 [Phellinidium pouzarii]|uniref:NADH-ubiquinone oxidoreductase B15 subunit n=1 Tax=Phellinidium pouzarii TaxID=167371 RepID=A0A4S4LBL0_9AGAM|nr:hypothetical protein EW145_g2637 [Phellinidium pouzarii]
MLLAILKDTAVSMGAIVTTIELLRLIISEVIVVIWITGSVVRIVVAAVVPAVNVQKRPLQLLVSLKKKNRVTLLIDHDTNAQTKNTMAAHGEWKMRANTQIPTDITSTATVDSVKVDPAFERWNRMREDVYKNFRWTKSTTRIAFVGLVAIPGLVCYICWKQDAKYSWAGKRKGEPLAIQL